MSFSRLAIDNNIVYYIGLYYAISFRHYAKDISMIISTATPYCFDRLAISQILHYRFSSAEITSMAFARLSADIAAFDTAG
jgi:hypothetical protein